MKKYLIKFSFGPVKDFLSAGRKIEDLFAGSSILDQLMNEMQNKLVSADIIYPFQENNITGVNLPNILLASVQSENISKMAKDLEKEATKAFKNIVSDLIIMVSDLIVKDKFIKLFTKEHLTEIIKRQTENFLDISWAYAEWDGGDESFKAALNLLNTRFDATKRTRKFAQQNEPGVKCVLQTSLSALLPNGLAGKDKEISAAWDALSLKKPPFSIRKGECFSTIGLAKRAYTRGNNKLTPFPSTYSIATAQWRKRILEYLAKGDDQDNKLKPALTEFKKQRKEAIESNEWDLSEVAPNVIPGLKKSDTDFDDILLKAEAQCFTMTKANDSEKRNNDPLSECRKSLVNAAKNCKLGTPPKHYALLIADGDSMGKIVDKRDNKKELIGLSQALNNFSSKAKELIENKENLGRIIFAGGDDVLGVLPLDNSLEAVCELRECYRETLEKFPAKNGKIPTLSAALLIAPVNYPLHRLLENAEHALNNEAKKGDKDALVIKVYKGNGEAVSVTLPTQSFYQEGKTVCNLADWAKLLSRSHLNGDLSSSAIYALKRDLSALVPDSGNSSEDKGLNEKNKLDMAEKLIHARLGTVRGINKTKLLIVRRLLYIFSKGIKAVDTGRTESPFNNVLLPVDTLIALRNIWRMKCLSN